MDWTPVQELGGYIGWIGHLYRNWEATYGGLDTCTGTGRVHRVDLTHVQELGGYIGWIGHLYRNWEAT